jgi:hypothetical protein
MPTMDDNPLFGLDPSDSETTSLASYTSSVDGDADAPTATTPPTAVLQTVNIKSHIPVILKLTAPNYEEWRCFFNAFLGKFGLTSHISAPPTAEQRHDPELRLRDQCILSWLYISIAKDVRDIVRAPKATAYRVWTAIHEQFYDNELHRAVYLEAEFRNLVQGNHHSVHWSPEAARRRSPRRRPAGPPDEPSPQHVVRPQLQVSSCHPRHHAETAAAHVPLGALVPSLGGAL